MCHIWFSCSQSLLGINLMASLRNWIDGPLVHTGEDVLMLSGVTEAMSAAPSSVAPDFLFIHMHRYTNTHLLSFFLRPPPPPP